MKFLLILFCVLFLTIAFIAISDKVTGRNNHDIIELLTVPTVFIFGWIVYCVFVH